MLVNFLQPQLRTKLVPLTSCVLLLFVVTGYSAQED